MCTQYIYMYMHMYTHIYVYTYIHISIIFMGVCVHIYRIFIHYFCVYVNMNIYKKRSDGNTCSVPKICLKYLKKTILVTIQ